MNVTAGDVHYLVTPNDSVYKEIIRQNEILKVVAKLKNYVGIG